MENQNQSMREAFHSAVEKWLAADPSGVVVLADISVAAMSHLNERYPGRLLNVGIREQAAIGVAAGLNLCGLHPLVHTYAPFLIERPLEMIKDDLFHQGLRATLVSIGASYDEPGYGRTHQCPEDIALLDSLGGSCDVFVPGNPDEVAPLLACALGSRSVSYLRLSVAVNRSPVRNAGTTMVEVTSGRHGVVIAVGPMLDAVLDASRDMDLTVLYATTIRPFDASTLRAVAGPMPEVMIVEPSLTGTSSSLVEMVLQNVPHRVGALGVGDVDLHRYGTREEHDVAHGLDAPGLARSFRSFFGS
ncbi:hypothetical protein [Ferrimicrobium sp.]|uniref:transketolase family protein n=1 Tax=Ferrimicrobium sp. TaxID=2926050 RepID=UPI0026121FC1|nr:hypothetical protein [Ferrimicrobium sp.]